MTDTVKKITFIKREAFTSTVKTERFFVFFVLFFTLFMETAISFVPSLSLIRYLNDAAIVAILLMSGLRFIRTFNKIRCSVIPIVIALFLLFSVLSAIVNLVPLRLFVWALRNTFRGIVFLLAAVTYFDIKDIDNIFNVLFYVQILNLLLALFQFFRWGYRQDDLGGIFGFGNAEGVIVFNSLLICYFFNAYLMKKERFGKFLFVVISSMAIAVMGEEKLLFIFFVIVLFLSVFLTEFTFRKILLVIFSIGAMVGGIYLLGVFFPNAAKVLLDFSKFFDYAEATYSEGYMIPRIGAFSFIDKTFFKGDVLKLLFGYGFGNCETSSFSIFQSSFYNSYGYYNYRWFTHQWVFIEGGIFGFATFFAILIVILWCIICGRKRINPHAKIYNNTGLLMAVFCIISVFYNATLKIDVSYIAYFSMAIGIISLKRYKLIAKRKKVEFSDKI